MTIPIDVVGPHLLEIFIVFVKKRQAYVSGPCGPDAWLIETVPESHPMTVVGETVRRVVGDPLLVHSTSWRWQGESVVLSFLAVVEPDLLGDYQARAYGGAELARGGATKAPEAIGTDQVLEHALRHLAWLAEDDPTVAGTLPEDWHHVLERFVPAPFQHL